MRTAHLVLLISLLATLVTTPAPAVAADDRFSDDDDTPYEPAINALAARRIVAGCDDEGAMFCPDAPVRRDQAASLLARAFKLPDTSRDFFFDDDGSVHEQAINRLAAAGISLGCADDERYCGGQSLRRNQMAALLIRAGEVASTDKRFFHDTGATHGAAVNRLAAAGVTGGCRSDTARFCPYRDVLRGEMAVFLARMLDLRPRTEMTPLPEPEPPESRESKRNANTVWDRLARCEAGGNWTINTGNGYYGGLQFSLSSWRAVGGSGYPHTSSRAEQIKRGKMLLARQGWGAWPACARKLGL